MYVLRVYQIQFVCEWNSLVRNSGSISLRFAYTRRRARSLFLFFCGMFARWWVICKQQKNYNHPSVPARLKKEIKTEKWIVWAPGLMNIIVSSQKYEGEERSFWTRGETKKGTPPPPPKTTTPTTTTPLTNAPKEKEHSTKRRPKGRGRRKFFFYAPGPARWVLVSSLSPFCDECFCSCSLVLTNGERKKRGDVLAIHHSPRWEVAKRRSKNLLLLSGKRTERRGRERCW